MKKIIFLFFIILCSNVFSTEIKIPDSVLQEISAIISDSEVYLEFNNSEAAKDCADVIKQFLVENNHTVITDNKSDYDYLLKFSLDKNNTSEIKYKMFSSETEKVENYDLSLSKIDKKNDRLILFRKFNFQVRSLEKNNSEYRWYDPILISSLIGGLVYLFYFGE